jgi:hypothetical protein
MKTAVFVLAHPDDDVFVLPLLLHYKQTHEIIVFFTTDTSQGYGDRRIREAKKAMNSIGINQVHFAGTEASAKDGLTIEHADVLITSLENIVVNSKVDTLVTHVLEGGNPDHDLAFTISAIVKLRVQEQIHFIAVPFYRRHNWSWVPYVVNSKISNMTGTIFRLPLRSLISIPFFCRHYVSQMKVLFCLIPFLLIQIMWRRGLLYYSSTNIHDYIQNLPNNLMIERQYPYNSARFYEQLLELWKVHETR